MNKIAIYNPLDYLDGLIELIDSSERDNFVDTSVILSPAISCYSSRRQGFTGYSFLLMKDIMDYYAGSNEYERLEKEIVDNFCQFKRDFGTLFEESLKISESINKELSDSISRHAKEIKENSKQVQNVQKYKRKSKNNFRKQKHGKGRKAITNIFRVPVVHRDLVDTIKRRNATLNNIISIEKSLVREIKKYSKEGVKDLYFSRICNEELYDKIFDAVNEAFARYKYSKRNNKNHQKSNDHRILSEVILHSYLKNRKVNLITADGDFAGMAMKLKNTSLEEDIDCDVQIIQKINCQTEKMPYFERRTKIRYNNRFLVE